MSGNRVLGLQRRKHNRVQGFHKTVHLEQIVYTTGTTSFRPGSESTGFSLLLEPRPIVRLISEEDISQGGENVSLGDYIVEIPGDQVTETRLRQATRIVLNKSLPDEELMQVLQVRPSGIQEPIETRNELFIVGGQVIRWKIFARATLKAA